jgi:hypothetical protein
VISAAIHIERHRPNAPRRGYLPLLASAALVLAGCSNEPLPPQGAIWTGSSNARTATLAPVETGSASAKPTYKTASGGDWGPYSGRRGQTEPPASMNYAFKGDPNASRTFAAAPGQM